MSTILPVKDKSGGRVSLKMAPFKSAIRRTDPHRHNGYLELIYLTAGEGVHIIDGRRYVVAPPVLFVIRRDQVHYWELTTPGEGYVLIIRKEYVNGSGDGRLRSLLASISGYSCLPLEANASVERLWAVLLDELEPGRLPERSEGPAPVARVEVPSSSIEVLPDIGESVLKALLGKIIELARPSVKPVRDSGGLYEQFLHLLEDNRALKRTVGYYAGLLHTTPQNLNNACRKSVDRPATEVLGDFLMSEAKRLLLYTNGSVAEISFELDFKDPSHFVKYFKRMAGRTPQAFRRE